MSKHREKSGHSSALVTPELPSPYVQMLDMTYTALVNARAIFAAAKLGIPDRLQDAPYTSDEIARAVRSPSAPGRIQIGAHRSYKGTTEHHRGCSHLTGKLLFMVNCFRMNLHIKPAV